MSPSENTRQRILNKLYTIALWRLNLFLVAGAVVAAMIFVCGFSLFFHGRIMPDYMIAGLVTSVLVAAAIIPAIIYFIKEMRASRDEHKKSQEFLSNIIETMSDGLFLVDVETSQFLDVNPQGCKMFGYTKEELLQKKVTEIDKALPDIKVWQEEMKHFAPKETYIINGEGLRKDGTSFPIEVSTRFSNETFKGRPYIISLVRDLTGRRKLENELEQIQLQVIQNERLASIGQLAAGVAHEINNPLGFVASNIEALGGYIKSLDAVLEVVQELQEALASGKDARAHEVFTRLTQLEKDVDFEFIKRDLDNVMSESRDGVKRIKSIVNNLRVFSRKSSDETSVIRIEEVLNTILDIVANEIRFKADLVKEYSKTSLVKGSTQQIGQVLMNILLNAVQALKQKGTITIRTFDKGAFVCVEISDTGEGIKESDLGRIFDAFFTTKPLGSATGLGLTISRQIIQNHGGEILVSSAVGKGATFTVKLPASS